VPPTEGLHFSRLGLVALVAFGCGGARWPDEPGIPVAVGRARNLNSDEAFIEALTTRRLGEALPRPIVTPALQRAIRPIAEQLQDGSVSAERALRASQAWGRSAYHRDVDAWVLDCAAGKEMWLPSALIAQPILVISYASAQFRPRSARSEQCATIVVSARGSEVVQMSPGPIR
jgi:hypothetical protein